MSNTGRPLRPPRRILLIKPSSLGDIVHALPVLAGLRDAYPDAHIAWLVGSSFAPLLADHPLLDEVITFDRHGYGKMLKNWRSLAEFAHFCVGLRRRRFDLVIDLQGLFRSGFFALVTGARQRIGFAEARELAPLLYSRRVRGTISRESTRLFRSASTLPQPLPEREGGLDSHAVERNLTLAGALGLPVEPALFPLGLRADELATARARLAQAAGEPLTEFVAVLPGTRWESKRWPAERLAELIDRLHADGLPRCVLLGAPDERSFSDPVRAAAHTPTVDLVGRTSLRELTALLALASLVICHDSGPMHIAAALHKPLVAIFGPTNPVRTGPYSDSARVVALPLECAPCYRRRCLLGHHNCMQSLQVDTVAQQVREVWATRMTRATCRTL
jgi:lipopolysaccharide heptosyltransferase II